MSSTDKRVILVTGSNKGIGLEAVRLLSEQLPQATILMGTRTLANGDAAVTKLRQANSAHPYSNIHPIAIDATDDTSIENAVAEVKAKYDHLDVLMNNHGISNVNGDGLHGDVLKVNFYGVKAVIDAFLPILPPSSTVVTVSSEVGSWTTYKCAPQLQKTLLDPSSLTWEKLDQMAKESANKSSSSHWPPASVTYGQYGVSKALLTPYMRLLALKHPELKVAIVCPGYCATDLNHNSGHRSAAQGGESVIFPITHSFESGHFYQDGKELEWSYKSYMDKD